MRYALKSLVLTFSLFAHGWSLILSHTETKFDGRMGKANSQKALASLVLGLYRGVLSHADYADYTDLFSY